MRVGDILLSIESYKCIGDPDKEILGVCSLQNAKEGHLTFCKGANIPEIITTRAPIYSLKDCIIILPYMYTAAFDISNVFILVDNPRLVFARIVKRFFSRSTFISNSSVYIEGDVHIGKRVQIQANVTIGTSGFGYERNEKGEWEYFPQIGGVIIEDDVDIGSNANIQRGTLDNTIIGRGSKIGPSCNIGHNSIIGKHTFVAGMTNLGGKTQIGDYCFIGMSVVTLPGIKIGNNVMIGAGAVVTKNVPDGVVVCGVPAKVIGESSTKYGD